VAVLTRNPGRLSRVVRPEIDRSGDFDDLRRTPAYLDSVDEIWHELKGYLDDEERPQ
jgi:NitT/TauT family transport system ATP-binding protein